MWFIEVEVLKLYWLSWIGVMYFCQVVDFSAYEFNHILVVECLWCLLMTQTEACHLVAIARTTILIPYHLVKSLQLTGRSGNVNPLHAKFFRGNRNIFTFYVIPPNWYHTGSWNPSSTKTRAYLLYIVNIMAADVLATQGARASATMILT